MTGKESDLEPGSWRRFDTIEASPRGIRNIGETFPPPIPVPGVDHEMSGYSNLNTECQPFPHGASTGDALVREADIFKNALDSSVA